MNARAIVSPLVKRVEAAKQRLERSGEPWPQWMHQFGLLNTEQITALLQFVYDAHQREVLNVRNSSNVRAHFYTERDHTHICPLYVHTYIRRRASRRTRSSTPRGAR